MRISCVLISLAVVLGLALAHPKESTPVVTIMEASATTCEDDPNLRFSIGKKKRQRSCKWAGKNPDKRCKKKTTDQPRTRVRKLCPAACNKCPAVPSTPPVVVPTQVPVAAPTQVPVAAPTESPAGNGNNGCCSLDYKNCISWCGSTYDECINCSNTEVGWLPNGAPQENCAARWEGCDENNDCCSGLTCQTDNGWSGCFPADDNTPTDAPMVPPTEAPMASPSTPPVPNIPPTQQPVAAPTPPPAAAPTPQPVVTPVVVPTPVPVPTPTQSPIGNGNGCCSQNYKDCISWCGSTYDECIHCSSDDVTWLPNGPNTDNCGARWDGCDENNDLGHNGCCSGLTCQLRVGYGYMACLPGGDNSPSPPVTAPQPVPTPTPVQVPTSDPPPVSPPVSPPTDVGGDLIDGKATYYGGNPSGGACGYNDLPQVTFPRGFSVAIGGDEFDDGYGCGACYEVTCVGPYGNNPDCFCGNTDQKTVVVQATDQCPECSSTHFDLNADAFTSIVQGQSSGMAGTCGILKTKFRRVSCDFSSDIKIRSKSGTSGYWYGLHVDDVAGYGALQSIKLREAGRRKNGQNEFDIVCDKSQGASFWYCNRPNNREISAPLDVELTDSAGRKLARNNIITNLNGNLEFDFGTNYGPMDGDNNPTPVSQPTPIVQPTPIPTMAPQPTIPFEGDLLSTEKAMNAWDVFLGLDHITHKNSESPPNYAVVASGGAAGSGSDVVSESQAYGLLITGTVLASWETHAGQVSGSSRQDVLHAFEGYYNFWKNMCKDSSNNGANCQPNGNYCKTSANAYVCLPDWKHSKTGGSVATGPAPDADEDAIVGIILAVKAVENHADKPSWYDEARKWADASSTAFFEFNVDKTRGDYRLVKLGSCWGGWENNGNNPSYHSPGSYRVMKDYQKSFPDEDRVGYSAISQSEWQKLIDTSHEVLRAVQCSEEKAMVPNWATIGLQNGSIVHSGGSFSGSGTSQYEYGAEAARTTFRVALDAAFYPDRSSEWYPYLSHFITRISEGSFPSCRAPNTNQNIHIFGDWENNAFIYGPTYSALITASTSDIGLIDAAGMKLSQALPGSYYPRSWAMISNLMLNGAMESAGNTLKG